MIAADTSTIAAYLGGHDGADTQALDVALRDGTLIVPPIVIAELLSRPGLQPPAIDVFSSLPRIDLADGFFERVGTLRRKIRTKGFRARLADALIAQSCLDAGVSLITRDRDFRHFAKLGGLKLV